MDLRKDIYFYSTLASFPTSGSPNALYVDRSTGIIYSWDGSSYVASGPGPVPTGLNYQGLWDANANLPAITSSVGTVGDYYIVGTAGTTNINGINDWGIGDWIVFSSTGVWQKIDNSDKEGYATVEDEGNPLTQRSTINFVGAGVSAADSGGKTVVTIPDYTLSGLGGVPTSRSISTNSPLSGGGDLSADRTLSISQASGATNGYLSSTDWSTFNGKQNAITLTTTGTSGAATLIGSTLNIPQYIGGLTNFTEAANSSAPNATVPVNSLTATGAATNIDVAIVPKGQGALLAQVPDGAFTQGNKRGAFAVDWQRVRNSNDRVASGSYSTVLNGLDSRASGSYSTAGGWGCLANNTGSVALGAINTAGGFGSACIGAYSSATQDYASAYGYSTSATGQYSYSFGHNNVSSGTESTTIGSSCTANAANSFAFGKQSHVFGIIGRQSYSNGRESADGDSQVSKFVLRERTTDATATVLTTNSSAASTNNQVILSNNAAYGFTGTIVGKKSGTTDAAMWKVEGLIARGANAASTVLTTSTVTLVSNAPGWGTPALTADTTNGGLKVEVTGFAATNIQWTAVIETTEVIYA